MNRPNKIDELFGKALDRAVPETWTTLNEDQLNRVKDEFAQLIIQDCISTVALIGISNFENDDISWAVEFAITQIKEKFNLK